MRKTIWAKIIGKMESQDMRPCDIARDLQVTQQNVSDVKAGKSKNPAGMFAVRLYKRGAELGMDLPL